MPSHTKRGVSGTMVCVGFVFVLNPRCADRFVLVGAVRRMDLSVKDSIKLGDRNCCWRWRWRWRWVWWGRCPVVAQAACLVEGSSQHRHHYHRRGFHFYYCMLIVL